MGRPKLANLMTNVQSSVKRQSAARTWHAQNRSLRASTISAFPRMLVCPPRQPPLVVRLVEMPRISFNLVVRRGRESLVSAKRTRRPDAGQGECQRTRPNTTTCQGNDARKGPSRRHCQEEARARPYKRRPAARAHCSPVAVYIDGAIL